jgi:hypothetical protein
MSFRREFAKGIIGESTIATWFKQRGSSVLPAYQVELESGKGPQFFTPEGKFVTPDMMIFPSMVWVEAKHKTSFTWHRQTGQWCTGIDLRHYRDYQQVARISRRPVWLMFLHNSGKPSAGDLARGCPANCPAGLFGAALDYLLQNENHRSPNWGSDGMVYWTPAAFRLLASLIELEYLQGYRKGKA